MRSILLIYPVVFITTVVLLGYVDHTVIYNPPFFCQKTFVQKKKVEAPLLNRQRQAFCKRAIAHGSIGHLPTDIYLQKTVKEKKDINPKFQCIVGEVVKRFQNKKPKQHYLVKTPGSSIRVAFFFENELDNWIKYLSIKSLVQFA